MGRAFAIRWALLSCLAMTPALAAGPVKAGDAERVVAARAALEGALAVIRAPGVEPEALAAARATAEGSLRQLEGLVDRYHHAPNLRDPQARPHVLALRPMVGRLFAAEGPLVLVQDVIHPRPALLATLADAARRAGDHPAEIRWLRAALATAPDDRALLTALRDACLAVGDVPAANAVALRLKAVVGGGAVSAP